MASSSKEARRNPVFLTTDQADPGNNETEVSRYAAEYGNHKIGTEAERVAFTTAGPVWTGLLWYDTTMKATYRYGGGSLGWVRDTGFILSVQRIAWSGEQYVFGGSGTPNQLLANGIISNPGRPYRMSFNARCEFGVDDPNTRYHLAIGTGGQFGNFPYAKDVDFNSIRKGASIQLTRVDTAPTIDVFTGDTRVVLQADLVEGGGFGIIAKPNRSFVVTVWAA